MEKIAKKITRYMVKEHIIREDEFEVYKYEFQVTLELSVCIAICMIIAIWTRLFIEGVLFWVLFFNIRSYLGGIHMRTYGKCLASSCIVFFTGILIAKHWDVNLDLLLLIDLVLIYILWRCELYQDENDKKAEVYFNNKLRKRLVIIGIVIMILRGLEMSSYMGISTYVLFVVWVSLCIGEAKKRLVSQ